MSQVGYPLNLFVPNKWNYNILTDEEFNELVEDTRKVGIREKITVRQKGEQFEVLNGVHRIKALKTIEAPDVPRDKVDIVSMTDSEARAYIRSSKTRGSKKDLIKEAYMVYEDFEELKKAGSISSLQDYSKHSGIEYSKLSRMLARCNLSSVAQQIVSQGNISAAVLDELLVVRQDYQREMITRAIDENWTVEQAKLNVKAGVTIDGKPVRKAEGKRESDITKLDMFDRMAVAKVLESTINGLSNVIRYCEGKGATITSTEFSGIVDKATKAKKNMEGQSVVYPYNGQGAVKSMNVVRDWLVAGTEDERKAKVAAVEERIRMIGGMR